ncbi:hypothetical protein N9D57_03295 [bacterium]|nr:hypothetical protein [bacterium]
MPAAYAFPRPPSECVNTLTFILSLISKIRRDKILVHDWVRVLGILKLNFLSLVALVVAVVVIIISSRRRRFCNKPNRGQRPTTNEMMIRRRRTKTTRRRRRRKRCQSD